MDNSLSRALGSRALITHTHASRPARTLDDDGDVPGRRTAVHGRGAKAECPAGPCRWFRPAAPGAGAAAACCTYTVACHHRCCRSPPSPSVTAAAAAPVGGEPEPRDGLRATQFNVIARREAIAHRGKRRAPYEKKKKIELRQYGNQARYHGSVYSTCTVARGKQWECRHHHLGGCPSIIPKLSLPGCFLRSFPRFCPQQSQKAASRAGPACCKSQSSTPHRRASACQAGVVMRLMR